MERRTRRRLGLEPLEARTLLAADCGESVVAPPPAMVASAAVEDQAVTPNDPLLNRQSTSGTINADEVWTTPRPSIVTAVIDSGVDFTHPDLYLSMWINQGEIPRGIARSLIDVDANGIFTFHDLNDPVNLENSLTRLVDRNENGYIDGEDLIRNSAWADRRDTDRNGLRDDLIGWDFYDNDNNPMDGGSHGTHVAGVIGATHNNGVGIAGVNPHAIIMPLRFLGPDGGGSNADAAEAIRYSYRNGARVSNNSWGYVGGEDSRLTAAIREAADKGQLFVVASGNDGFDLDERRFDSRNTSYPSASPASNVIAVAAVDRRDHLAGFSNIGRRYVDVAAPGVGIYSTVPDGDYTRFSGTSMAAPHVAGAIGLIWAENPELSAGDVRELLFDTVDELDALNGEVRTGGRINVATAVRQVRDELRAASIDPGPFDLANFASLKAAFGSIGDHPSDLDRNGIVDLDDFAYLKSRFGV